MEKRKAHYPLKAIQAQMVDVPSLKLTSGALNSILFELGWDPADALDVVQALRPSNFYKSMTTARNHRAWQDVYRARWRNMEIYLKFQRHEDAYFFTVSFKEL